MADFDILVDYMAHGKVPHDAVDIYSLDVDTSMAKARSFIEYTDKYDLKNASEAILDSLRNTLCRSQRDWRGHEAITIWISQETVRF